MSIVSLLKTQDLEKANDKGQMTDFGMLRINYLEAPTLYDNPDVLGPEHQHVW